MYKSVNAGDTWTELTAISGSSRLSGYLAQQGWYNNVLVVSPTDANVVIGAGTSYVRSTDGGITFQSTLSGSGVHVDAHDLRYQGSTLWIANDGGIWTSPDDAFSATERNAGLVTRQYYALAIDPVNRNRILAGSQDNGTSQRTDAGGTEWRDHRLGRFRVRSESDRARDRLGNHAVRERVPDAGGRKRNGAPNFENVTPPYDDGELKPFLSILKVDPWSPNTIYAGSYRVWRSRDGGTTWVPPDHDDRLVRVAFDDVGELDRVRADRSPHDPRRQRAGDLPLRRRRLDVDRRQRASHRRRQQPGHRSARRQRRLRGHRDDDGAERLPQRFRRRRLVAQRDGASGFRRAGHSRGSHGLERRLLRDGRGVYRSTDRGATWSRFGNGLPAASVHDLAVLPDGSMLRIATHGRGIWELQVPPIGKLAAGRHDHGAGRRHDEPFPRNDDHLHRHRLDPDAGDSATGTWFFPDTAEAVPLPSAPGVVAHTFRNAGVFPVTLTARDTRGALGSTSVLITIAESGDACASPIVIPAAGPFPYSVTVNNESSTSEGSDPVPVCVPVGTGTAGSIWFEFTPQTAGSWEFSTCGALADTVLSVYTGAACGPYTAVASGCNDDTSLGGCGAQASVVTVTATAGQTLRIQATGFSAGSVGSFPLTG